MNDLASFIAKGWRLQPDGFTWAKPPRADDKRTRPSAATEKLEVDLPQPKDRKAIRRHQARDKGMDAKSHPKFAVRIDLLVSDNIRRDADGCLTTLLDCLVAALREIR